MFNIMVGVDYVLPPPHVSADIPAVASVAPFKETRRNKDGKKGRSGNRKRTEFKELIEKEANEEFGRMGCFFERKV